MEPRFRFGVFELDSVRGVLTRDGSPISLGNRALSVLEALLRAGGKVVTKNELMAAAWQGTVVEEANLSVQIATLRKVLAASPGARGWITTASRVGYRFTGPLRVIAAAEATPAIPVSRPDKPSIVVLPFTNLSGEAGQEYVADGITEDIIDALSRYRWFFVLARNSSFALKGNALGVQQVARELGVRYLLEGSVRKSGQRIRITAALSDVASASQIWADRFEFALTDMFSVQDRIVQHVAGAMEPELLKSEAGLAIARPGAAAVTAWDLVRQGTHAFHKVERESHLRARELFREAISREPDLPEAHIWLARASAGIVAYGWSAHPQADIREGLAAAGEAIRRDERSPYAHYALAIVSAYAGEPAQAIRAAERALELNPSFALGHLVLGMARLFAGRPQEAIEALEHGLALNAYDPQNFVWYNLLAFAHYFAGEFDRAMRAAERAWGIRSNWRISLELMACCHLALGDADAAARCVEQMAPLPAPTDKLLAPLEQTNPGWRERIDMTLKRMVTPNRSYMDSSREARKTP
jgi:TolB-like protein/Tfp pilus assembly protein PilF